MGWGNEGNSHAIIGTTTPAIHGVRDTGFTLKYTSKIFDIDIHIENIYKKIRIET